MVRTKGLEPPPLSGPEPKSGASTSSATSARGDAVLYHARRRDQIIGPNRRKGETGVLESPAFTQAGRGHRIEDGIHIQPIMFVEVGQIPRLAEMFDAQGMHPVSEHGAHPGQGQGMAVDDGDQGGIRREGLEQRLDM